MTATLALPAVLDIQAADTLRAQFLAARGQDVVVDASNVDRLGALCLQVLLSAQQTWAGEAQTITIDQASDAFVSQWTMFGAPPLATTPGDPA